MVLCVYSGTAKPLLRFFGALSFLQWVRQMFTWCLCAAVIINVVIIYQMASVKMNTRKKSNTSQSPLKVKKKEIT